MYQINKLHTNIFGLSYRPELLNYSPDEDLPLIRDNLSQENIDYEFSECNRTFLESEITKLKLTDDSVIVEIGVHRNSPGFSKTSTMTILGEKPIGAKYVGIDLDNKVFLNDPELNIFTIQCPSQDFSRVYAEFDKLNIKKIDLLMIDGFHSLNQVLFDWQYSSMVRVGGLIGIHDTNFHPGPVLLCDAINRDLFTVTKHCQVAGDHGIAFAKRIN